MKKIFTFVAAALASMSLWAANPDYESYDWASADEMAAGLAGDASVTISVVTGGSDGNVSGHWYKPLNGAIDGSAANLGTYLAISSATQIDSVEIFFCPNGTSNTNLAWAGWGKGVTPSEEVGENYGTTESIKSSKSWDNATWQMIDLSEKEIYTIYISRQGKKLKNNSTIANFGDNQTVNLLGLRVWLASGTPSADPVSSVVIAGPEAVYVGKAAAYTATPDKKATVYKWTVNDVEQNGETSAKFEYTPAAEGTYSIKAYAKNDYNTDWAVSNAIALVATEKPAATVCAQLYPATEGAEAAQYGEVALKAESDGGKIIFVGAKDGKYADSFLYTEYGLQLCKGGADSVRVILNKNLEAGSTIELTIHAAMEDDKDRGFNLQNCEKKTKLAAVWKPKPTAESESILEKTFVYDVVEGDGLAGNNAFILARSNSAILTSVIVSGCAEGDVPSAIENTEAAVKAVKVVRNGQMFIQKNGVLYNMQGAVVK